MGIQVGWLDPPTTIGGLDHLGTQAPCILVYSQLLPGITNVTDRARYYSFYPWLIWSFDQRFSKDQASTLTEFIELYRRADCLFTLIAERHSQCTDDDPERHGVAMVGRNALLPALRDLGVGNPLDLADHTAATAERRYFKNAMGGLGQYYAGMLAELQVLEFRPNRWPAYTQGHGARIAQSFDAQVPSDQFWDSCVKGQVTLEILDQLAPFCPCHLAAATAEREELKALFFGQQGYVSDSGQQRRRSLDMLLNLAAALAQAPAAVDLTQAVFRGCVHTGHLPDGSPWLLPEALAETQKLWSIYQRGDLLSVAFQGLFVACLLHMEQEGPKHSSVESFVSHFLQLDWVLTALKSFPGPTFADEVRRYGDSGPSIAHWADNEHEVSLAKRIVDAGVKIEDPGIRLRASLMCVIALAVRNAQHPLKYGDVGLADEVLTDYPINVVSFLARSPNWMSMPVRNALSEMLQWTLQTHLRVALRKLRQTGQSSFRFRPSDLGLEVVEVPPPTHTVPRFRQAMQIMRDIGLIGRDQAGISHPAPGLT